MRKIVLCIVLWCGFGAMWASNTIEIPLQMSVVHFMPTDGPTGSTPDPTDPNQFHATLTGNRLTIFTQKDAVSYAVVRSGESETKGEDYFYSLSYDSVSCPITHAGLYRLFIGHWNTDFVGTLIVTRLIIADFNGKIYDPSSFGFSAPQGMYIIYLQTNMGTTYTKIYHVP